jgi:hypothetical protein
MTEQPLPQPSDPEQSEVQHDALALMQLFRPADRDTARSVLGRWPRRAALTNAGIDTVLDAYFDGTSLPPPPKPLPPSPLPPSPSPCPSWCTLDHRKYSYSEVEHSCEHSGKVLDARAADGHQIIGIDVMRSDNLAEGTQGPIGVWIFCDDALDVGQTQILIGALQGALEIIEGERPVTGRTTRTTDRCRYLTRHGNQCTGEPIDTGEEAEAVLCIRHVGDLLALLTAKGYVISPPKPKKS